MKDDKVFKLVSPLPEISALAEMQKHLSGFEKLKSATAMTTNTLSSFASATSQIADRFSGFQNELKKLSSIGNLMPKVEDLERTTESFRHLEEQNERFARTSELLRLEAKRKNEVQSAIVESRDTLEEQVGLLNAMSASTAATHMAIQEIASYSVKRDQILAEQRAVMECENARRFRITLWISLAVLVLTAYTAFLQVR